MEKDSSFYVGLGVDIDCIDNIYRCATDKDLQFLKDRLRVDIKSIEDYLAENPDDEKDKAVKKLNLAWLNRIKFWRVKVTVEGEF